MADEDIEVWESTTEASVFVPLRDPRTPGAFKTMRIYGRSTGNHRLRISRGERELIQESTPEKNRHLDPFTNGTLVCVSGRTEAKGRYELTDADLIELLNIADEAVFEEALTAIDVEVPLRRLVDLAEAHSSHARYRRIRDLVAERYRVGGTQRTVAEMLEAGEKIGATMLS